MGSPADTKWTPLQKPERLIFDLPTPERWKAQLTFTKVNSAFHPSGVSKSSTGLSGRGNGYARLRVLGDTVWSHMADDAPSTALRWVFCEELCLFIQG